MKYFFLIGMLFCFSCSPMLYPDRSQFLKDGETVPTVDLSYYKSVQLRPNQDSSIAVAMAISGGGSRAANFGVGVMMGLEELSSLDKSSVLKEIDYFSTVSGGGFAAGAYISSIYQHHWQSNNTGFAFRRYVEDQLSENLTHSYAGVLVRANFNPRLWFSYVDDGDALEKAIDDQVLGYKYRRKTRGHLNRSILLSDLFIPANSSLPVKFPMHITNSSVLSTMSSFPFTPDILDKYKVKGYTHRMRSVVLDEPNPFTVPLAVGIKSSGSFPVLISNSTLVSDFNADRKFLHLIDGAMTDNIGYYTALDVLKQDNTNKKILLIVDANASGHYYTFSKKKGAINALNVLVRLPSSGLLARQNTLIKDIITACDADNIIPVFFSFNKLLENNKVLPPESFNAEIQYDLLVGKLSRKESLSDMEKQMLYEILTQIGTKYTMTDKEQKILFLTGQYLVKLQEEEIKAALGWK
jgi:hypothetical protein